MSLDERDELTAAAIARLAGVGRAAVSNWRRRHSEFPKPIGGSSTSPTFSRAEVEAWLKATGKAGQLVASGRTTIGTQRVNGSPASSGGEFEERLRQLSDRAVADLTPGELLARVMASLLPCSTASERPVAFDDADAPTVLDPACSQGTLLMAVTDRFGNRVRLAGQETGEPAAAIAAFNLRGDAHGTPYEIHVGNSLLNNRLGAYLGTAAAVVCELLSNLPRWPSAELAVDARWEFGTPSPRDGELAWVQHCYAHLRPRGVAVVAVSPRTCVQSSGQDIRAALVRSGALRDVIALPKGMGSLPDSDVYLWVLQRPQGAPDDAAVRIVDLSGLNDAADVPCEHTAWQRLLTDADVSIVRAIPRLELLDGDANLLPSRHVATRVQARAEDFVRVIDRLQALYTHVGQGLPRFAAPTSPLRHSYVTIGELERIGALRICSRGTTPRDGDLLLLTLGRPPTVASGTETDDAGVGQVVQVKAALMDAYFLAAFLRADVDTLPTANTLGVLSRDDLRRCRIPRMPVAQQRRYGKAFRYLQELQEALSALSQVSANMTDQIAKGLTTGALTPDRLPAK
ncbi:MAG: N-6 DNA methylase [Gammaproteobacteria bacterium]